MLIPKITNSNLYPGFSLKSSGFPYLILKFIVVVTLDYKSFPNPLRLF
jgi:hypothetical protein